MISKISGLARLIATLLAIVAGFIAIPSLNVPLALVALGIIAGISVEEDNVLGLFISILVLPAVAVALGTIPTVGEQLGAVANNIATSIAGAAATMIAMRMFGGFKADLGGLAGK